MRSILAVIVFLACCAPVLGAEPSPQALIVGHWYEDMLQHGVRTISIAHNYADGAYTAVFRQCLRTGVHDTSQAGHWRYDKGKVYLTTEVVDGRMFYSEQTYEVVSVDKHIFDYRLIAGSGPERFHDVRVTADSKMPDCDLTS